MVVVALGAAVGMIKFGPLRFGAAGALFVGLAIGALDPALGGAHLGLVQTLGLALFVYTVGLAAGQTFFADLRSQSPVMLLGLGVAAVVAVVAIVLAKVFDIDAGMITGIFAGSLTSTPALSAATAATGSPDAAVGYSLGYPVGVILAIIAVALVVNRNWPGRRDSASLAGEGLMAQSVKVTTGVPVRSVPGWADESIKMSYLIRDGHTRVISPGEDLHPDDRVLVVGTPAAVQRAMEFLGEKMSGQLTDNRTDVDFRRFVVSDPSVAGRTVAQLNLPGRFGGVITRVRRGDTDLLARDDLVLQLGDRVLAVVPHDEMDAITDYLGDSERKVSEVDALTLGLGLALGLLLGAITVPLPGGIAFSLGAAAGPLIVGMILGAVHRTGPLIWQIPLSANLTLRQLGLLLFLATVGLASGQSFARQAFTAVGLRAGLIAAALVLTATVLLLVGARLMGRSAQRAVGAFAGFIGQPAILAFATDRVDDERIESGYATLFALGIIVKIIAVYVMAALI
ncbi:aspartate:alanine exchanger family transporter [Enemella sp. A6]|uniref:aspartate:alanine exchanger family transporter n=1 Tax=Enemella sp. A6 TaxID=3440152 RepID=UPI003EBBE6EC